MFRRDVSLLLDSKTSRSTEKTRNLIYITDKDSLKRPLQELVEEHLQKEEGALHFVGKKRKKTIPVSREHLSLDSTGVTCARAFRTTQLKSNYLEKIF